MVPTLNDPDTLNNAIGTDEIDYDFLGFDPRDIFQFEADVDEDGTSFVEDYRDVLFPDAVLTVGFSNGETLSQVLNPADTNLTSYEFTQTAKTSVLESGVTLLKALLGICAFAFWLQDSRIRV